MINIKFMQLYNIILIYLIANVIVNYLTGINFSILSCGIFAWVGKETKFFRKDLFNILGMYNDNRGGDACGLYYDDNWYKGIGSTAKYEKLIIENDLHNTLHLKKYPLIIGHDRKTSVGHDTIDNAQPVVLVEYDTDDLLLVQAHNGTITNFRDLAKKYEIEIINGESDSIILAKLIDSLGWGVLSEYEGSAALVIMKHNEPNVLYAFHGKSKLTEHAFNATEERPLAYLTFPNKGTYISSDISHLKSISIPKKNIVPIEFKHNIVYKLEGDTVTEFMQIDRSKIFPDKKSSFTYKNNFNNSSKTYYSVTPLFYGDDSQTIAIRYYRGLYRLKDEPVHGKYIIDAWGWPVKNISFNKNVHYELSFIHGVLMKDRLAYEKMLKFLKDENIMDIDEFYESTNWNKYSIVEKLKKYSLYPFWRYDEKVRFPGFIKPNTCSNVSTNKGYYYFDGTFKPLLSRLDFKVFNGDINTGSEGNILYSIDSFIRKNDIDPILYDFSETTREKLNKINALLNDTVANKPVITLPVITKKDFVDCATCRAWETNSNLCTSCVDEVSKEDDNYEKEFKEYEKTLGNEVMSNSFKEVTDALGDTIDTYDSMSLDFTDTEVEEIIIEIRKLYSKLIKY